MNEILDATPLLRKTLMEADGRETALLTHLDFLHEAVDFANQQQYRPPICVVDWNGEANERVESLRKPGVEILPAESFGRLVGCKFCLSGKSWVCPFGNHVKDAACRLKGGVLANGIDRNLHAYLSGWWSRPGWPDIIARRMTEIASIYSALVDEQSKSCFAGVVKSLQTGDPGYMPVSSYFHYFHPEAEFARGSVVFEGGTAQGYQALKIAEKIGVNGKVICFEPLENFYSELKTRMAGNSSIQLVKLALSDKKGKAWLSANNQGSRLVESGEGAQPCELADIDSWSDENGVACNAIKLDIEGEEMACLKGAKKTIARYYPLLVISIYHHAGDNFDIPLWLMENFPQYELRIGHHSIWHHETVLYAKWRGQ